MKALFTRFVREEDGQDMIEYALLAALIAVVIAAVLPGLATAISDTFGDVQDSLEGGGGS
jgi:pilus assembly protein Flp/PilA